ncbi:hypothetical protein CF336_g5718 [Tilletia laevis]|nr:hypothetical protein CF336_g5718 [Tilletia laevis]
MPPKAGGKAAVKAAPARKKKEAPSKPRAQDLYLYCFQGLLDEATGPSGGQDAASEDEDDTVGALLEAKKPAKLALDISVLYHEAKKSNTGAGAPARKAKTIRRVVEVHPKDSFETFKANVIAELQAFKKKYTLGSVAYTQLDLEAKIPKGAPVWKVALAIDSDKAFKDFKENVFQSSDRYAESKIDLQEVDPEAGSDSDDSGWEDEDIDAQVGFKRKKTSNAGKGATPSSSKTASDKIVDKKVDTLLEINRRWACKDGNCNFGGQCIRDRNGTHVILTKRKKESFVRSVVEYGVGTIENPPAFLFDVEDKPRGRSGSRPSATRTPSGKGKAKADVTIILSSPASSFYASPRRQTSSSGAGGRQTQPSAPNLKRSLTLPLLQGPMVMLIEDAAKTLRLHPETSKNLFRAGFMRVSQVASSYETNFDAFVQDLKLTTGMLSDVEDLLKYWSQMISGDGTYSASSTSKAGTASTGGFDFGPSDDDSALSDTIFNLKKQDTSELGGSPSNRVPLFVDADCAISVPDSYSSPHAPLATPGERELPATPSH